MTVTHQLLKQHEERLVRIESRLVQLMYHMGMKNPHEKMYDAPITPDNQGKEFQ